MEKGVLVVLSGPSGTGKGTLMAMVRQQLSGVRFSVSATSRSPRTGEVDGKDYFFKTVEEFERMIEENGFVEWVRYCENYYGTPAGFVRNELDKGEVVILEIEVEGAKKVRELFPDSVLIFVIPPSIKELRKRIQGRGTENEEVIEARMERAVEELKLAVNYDYIIVNDSLDRAFDDIKHVVNAEMLKTGRNLNKIKEIFMTDGGKK